MNRPLVFGCLVPASVVAAIVLYLLLRPPRPPRDYALESERLVLEWMHDDT